MNRDVSPVASRFASAWNAGWCAGARRVDSPNFSARSLDAEVNLIVVHSISLPPGVFEGDAVEQLFTNTLDCSVDPYYARLRDVRVSAHFLLRRNGEIVQFVSNLHKAWHAGASSYAAYGDCNGNSIGIELEGLEGGAFTCVQMESLAALCLGIATENPIRFVAGHEHIAPVRKCDPGRQFDWAYLQRLTAWPSFFFPALAGA